MKPTALFSRAEPESNRSDRELSGESQKLPKHRMRVLLFGCSADDAQRTLRFGDRMEVAFLPSYDMDEIRHEIARFKPKLVTCRADVFLSAFSSPQPTDVTLHNNQGEGTLSPGLPSVRVTPRELKVLAMLAQGKTNNEMAKVLRLSVRTVKRTLSDLFERLGASNRTELSSRAAGLCLLQKDA